LRYGIGSAGQNVAMTALSVLAFVEDPVLAIAPFGWAMATSIGASTRTAVIPWITVSSAVILLVPMAIGALLRPETAVQLAGGFALVNLYATIECARYLNLTFLDRLLTQREVSHQAAHDGLTGLLNRRAFEQHLTVACTSGCPGALLALDLDGFKTVNDTRGHAAGDEILRRVASRLRAVVGASGLSARIGGDEFLVLVDDSAAAERIAGRIVASLSEPYALDGSSALVGVSVGLAFWSGQDAGSLAREADEALYRAKRGGRGRYAVARTDIATAA
jgi:diguanylate cyclase (GGDEF)-like protein